MTSLVLLTTPFLIQAGTPLAFLAPGHTAGSYSYMTGHQLDLPSLITTLGLAIQPVFHPEEHTPIQTVGSQLLREDAMGDNVKGFTEVQADCIDRTAYCASHSEI